MLLVDGDILLYKAATSVEIEIDWGDDFWTLHADASAAKTAFDQEIRRLQKRLDTAEVTVALSDPHYNWRLEVLATYKQNRRGKRKPVVYRALKEYAKSRYETAEIPGLEADDVLGVLSGPDHIIVSEDKDLKTIPGVLYNPAKDSRVEITTEEADRNHLLQTLTGDSVDGYSGCPGIGPKRAAALLERGGWEEVVGAYVKAGLSEHAALGQARVARILRPSEYNHETEEVLLWNPT